MAGNGKGSMEVVVERGRGGRFRRWKEEEDCDYRVGDWSSEKKILREEKATRVDGRPEREVSVSNWQA